jgi:toxin HigB-1
LDILFASSALKRLCHDDTIALRTLDRAVVHRLRARLDDLNAAASLGYAARLPGRFRALAVQGHFAFQLCGGFHLVIAPADKPLPRGADGAVNLDKISSITVISIGKVHD